MALSKLEQLYRQVILDHAQHPRGKQTLPHANASIELVNPSCGDVICLQLYVENDRIIDAAFSGHGCSISQASASMLVSLIKQMPIAQANQKVQAFFDLVQGKQIQEDLGDASLLQGVAKFPARIKCATLAWKALEQLVEEEKKDE